MSEAFYWLNPAFLFVFSLVYTVICIFPLLSTEMDTSDATMTKK